MPLSAGREPSPGLGGFSRSVFTHTSVPPEPFHEFGAPELTGPDGTPTEVPDLLAGNLRRDATDPDPLGQALFDGLDPDLAVAILAAARKIAAEPVEHAIVLSGKGAVLRRKTGKRDSVSIESGNLAGAHFVHNHPEGTPLSDADLMALYETDLASVWAVGGSWLYGAMIGRRGKSRSTAADLKMTHGTLSRAAFAVVSDLFRYDPAITAESLECRHSHAVLSELAAAGFIRYCRLRYGA